MLNHSKYRVLIILLFLVGLILQVLLSFSYWVGGDQMHLLELGMRLLDSGELSSFSKLKNGGGTNLGSLMQILVAGPLFIWENFRAPMLVPILFNIIAYLMISKIILDNYQDKGLLIFTIIFWLSPIRLYNTGFLWEPAYILLPAAMHLYSAYFMRNKKSSYLTFIHVLSLFLALQIHNSVLILVIASLYLLSTKKVKLDVKGLILGCFIGLLFFIPLIFDFFKSSLPESTSSSGYFGQSLIEIAPFLKGVFYFVKMTTSDMVKPITETYFWDGSYRWIMYVFQVLSICFVIFGVYANIKYYRGNIFKKWTNDYQSFSTSNLWLKNYGVSIFWGLTISAALSPITLQAWMVLIIIFAAILPLQHLLSSYNYKKQKPKIIISAFFVIEIILILTIYLGQLKFNRSEKYPNQIQEQKYEKLKKLFD